MRVVGGGAAPCRGVDTKSGRGPFGRVQQAVPDFLERELRNVRIADLFARPPFVTLAALLTVRWRNGCAAAAQQHQQQCGRPHAGVG